MDTTFQIPQIPRLKKGAHSEQLPGVMEYYLAIKRNAVLMHATMETSLEGRCSEKDAGHR